MLGSTPVPSNSEQQIESNVAVLMLDAVKREGETRQSRGPTVRLLRADVQFVYCALTWPAYCG